ncbi:hypothetical protein DBV15_00797 [Temnothorax longispinosus]|uniref:Uncharacterized protein n=1 Tax=Temnothorax longispinosus TaxID=300112 RepID=A0A4S2KKL6_9HYME|nr:hypothetical protein DBV15_00797 [Temnothorax longispinosus]
MFYEVLHKQMLMLGGLQLGLYRRFIEQPLKPAPPPIVTIHKSSGYSGYSSTTTQGQSSSTSSYNGKHNSTSFSYKAIPETSSRYHFSSDGSTSFEFGIKTCTASDVGQYLARAIGQKGETNSAFALNVVSPGEL